LKITYIKILSCVLRIGLWSFNKLPPKTFSSLNLKMGIKITQKFYAEFETIEKNAKICLQKVISKTNAHNVSLSSSIPLTCKSFGTIWAIFFTVPQAHIHVSWYTQSQIMITLGTLYFRAPILHLGLYLLKWGASVWDCTYKKQLL
jgi:hypothetical protein